MTCVAVSGDALYLMIVTLRKVPDDIHHSGHHPGKDVLMERNVKPYVDRPLFGNSIRHHSMPYITALRTNLCYSNAEVVLLMDNCSAHVTPEIFRLLGENHITIVTFSLHTTHIFQALDLSLFGMFKTREKFWTEQDHDKTFAATIHKLVRQFHLVATPESICGSFVRAGFSCGTGAVPYVLEFLR
jgi:hypothetical protein